MYTSFQTLSKERKRILRQVCPNVSRLLPSFSGMLRITWSRRDLMSKQFMATYFLLSAFVIVLTLPRTEAAYSRLTYQADAPPEGHPSSPADEGRVKRSSETVPEDVAASFSDQKDKKVPRRFLGIRGQQNAD